MRTVEASATVPADPGQLWPFISEPPRWAEWLTIHKSWKSDPPPVAVAGAKATASATAMNMPISIDWTFEEVDPQRSVRMSGVTRARVELALTIRLIPGDGGTRVDLVTSVDGGMIDGPMGIVFKNALSAALHKSLRKLGEISG
ncbi:carbon monoxide dehydrogenase subunit G [Nocardioides aromaticivorans]|uniref:Carbon monoxide dehydrogenase subunit G n=1 Tax=Nocardioides aromaticivorans TaxID=200618 RepID=A0A7Z0CMU6_9ACTN|nr:SRPBCC family protein [Nocardioides aromaticivorans]NYI44473.1 carbon monoxide dehydrogenase subunit G [Nocardioides aromaticivorans]